MIYFVWRVTFELLIRVSNYKYYYITNFETLVSWRSRGLSARYVNLQIPKNSKTQVMFNWLHTIRPHFKNPISILNFNDFCSFIRTDIASKYLCFAERKATGILIFCVQFIMLSFNISTRPRSLKAPAPVIVSNWNFMCILTVRVC